MSAQDQLIEEIRKQPEPVVLELWRFLKFLKQENQDEEWADLLPGRQVEQEVLNIVDHQ